MVEAEGLYKGNALCETFYKRFPGCKPIEVVFEAPLESETELSGAVSMGFWRKKGLKWRRK